MLVSFLLPRSWSRGGSRLCRVPPCCRLPAQALSPPQPEFSWQLPCFSAWPCLWLLFEPRKASALLQPHKKIASMMQYVSLTAAATTEASDVHSKSMPDKSVPCCSHGAWVFSCHHSAYSCSATLLSCDQDHQLNRQGAKLAWGRKNFQVPRPCTWPVGKMVTAMFIVYYVPSPVLSSLY